MSLLDKVVNGAVNSIHEFGRSDVNAVKVITDSDVSEMEFNLMKPFPGHIFRLYEGQQLEDMVESIKQFGILIPIILWQKDNNIHIVLSGHNRVNAGKIAGLTKGPVTIKTNLTYEEAVLIVTETNLRQRSFSDLSHSERALCLSQHYEAMKCQGKRTDLIKEIETLLNPHGDEADDTSVQVEQKSESRGKIGNEYGLSATNVTRYIRLATLTPALLEFVDTGDIAFLAAYDLSFIEDKGIQTLIANIIKRDGCKVDMKKAALLREYYKSKKLNETVIKQILSGEKTRKPKSDKPKPFQLKPAVVGKYFTNGETSAEIEETIDKALTLYFSNQGG